MDSHRASKRRKLDNDEQGSKKGLSSSQPVPTALGTSKKGLLHKSRGGTSQPLTNGTKESTAHQAWLEAKARGNARRGRKLSTLPKERVAVDVYDDIEGAHTTSSPPKKLALPNSTPVKKPLDPLRNQKPTAVTPSPSKTASTLGFFKQFHQAKAESSPNTSKRNGAGLVNGLNVNPVKDVGAQANGGASPSSSSRSEEETEDDDQPQIASPIPLSAKGNMKGWAYEAPKKTFEDEIKELAESARQDAEKEENTGVQSSSAQKLRDRSATVKQKELSSTTSGRQAAAKATPKKLKISGGRATKQNEHVDIVEHQKPSMEDVLRTATAQTPTRSASEKKLANAFLADTITPTKPQLQNSALSQVTLEEATLSKEHMHLIRKILLEKLTGKRSSRLVNLEEEYAKISNLITQTITAGESNSMLVIGSRGSGKSAIVNNILQKQTAEHSGDFHVIRLNGFIHTDDKIALREIWRQLGREMELDEEESTSKSMADTLTTLLALLSHPAEHGREESGQVTKSVVFILDEFELFASHPRQTLLYNLFDIAQSRKAPIAVLGLTTRIDVAESLEKRVKSRFSHRYVHLSSAKSFAAFEEACKAALSIDQSDLSADERIQLGMPGELTAKLQGAANTPKKSVVPDWNATIDATMSHETFKKHLHRIYYTTKSVPDFHASVLMPISTISTGSNVKNVDIVEHLTTYLTTLNIRQPDSKIDLLSSLSTLQLALLICAARLTNIHSLDTVPFAQAYEEYKVLASKSKLQASASGALAQGAGNRVWGKDVAKGAWEDLIEFGLMMEDGSRGCRVDVGLEEIGMSGVELGSWGRWCKEI